MDAVDKKVEDPGREFVAPISHDHMMPTAVVNGFGFVKTAVFPIGDHDLKTDAALIGVHVIASGSGSLVKDDRDRLGKSGPDPDSDRKTVPHIQLWPMRRFRQMGFPIEPQCFATASGAARRLACRQANNAVEQLALVGGDTIEDDGS